jgi:2-aminoethylphosphonate aminotransferase
MILLNPGPANTTETVKQAMTRPDICPREREFGDLMGRVRDGVTRVVTSSHEYTSVLFTGSGTAAVEAAIASAVPANGRLLVIDNGSYGTRMAQIAEAYGMRYDVESFGVGGYPDVNRIAARIKHCEQNGPRYTQLAVVHHETSTGMMNPVDQLGALCQDHDIELIVDAMSSYAGIPIDIEHMGASFLISSSNKCIQGMAGIGFVICKRERVERMQHIPGRSMYLSMAAQHRYFEREHQMQFTPPVQVLYALDQALVEYEAEGGAARHARYMANWEALDGGIRGLGFRRLLPEAILSRILTAYLEPDHPRYSFDDMHDRLYAQGFTIYPGKGANRATFRLANMGAVAPDDMRAFVKAMAGTLSAMGVEMGVDRLYSTQES